MKIAKLDFPVMSSWMETNGLRLDSGPYLSGAIEAKVLLEKLPVKKEPLHQLTIGHSGGIYNGPQFVRNYVDDPAHGVPFLTSSSMLLADLSTVALLRKKDAESSKLSYLRLKEGMTLISCSGTIGRMVYTRPDMEGVWSSQDILKVVPDSDKILPGYLYAYLSSRFGVPLVVSGTYGAIIQHIEPHHIADLPVPIFGEQIESEADGLIRHAANLRINAFRALEEAKNRFDCLSNGVFETSLAKSRPRVNAVSATKILSRIDAAYHDPVVSKIEAQVCKEEHTTISAMCQRIFLPGIFKRIFIDDERYGAPYYSGASLFWLEPIPKGILSRRSSLFEDVQLESGTILVQAFGQAGGLVGRPIWVGKHLDGATTTHMLVRLKPQEPELAGYLYAYIASSVGHVQIARLPYGGSIPHLDEKGISGVPIPILPRDEMLALSRKVLAAFSERDEALDCELKARLLVERAIERGGT